MLQASDTGAARLLHFWEMSVQQCLSTERAQVSRQKRKERSTRILVMVWRLPALIMQNDLSLFILSRCRDPSEQKDFGRFINPPRVIVLEFKIYLYVESSDTTLGECLSVFELKSPIDWGSEG